MARVGTSNYREKIKHPVGNDTTWSQVVHKECALTDLGGVQIRSFADFAGQDGPTLSTAHSVHTAQDAGQLLYIDGNLGPSTIKVLQVFLNYYWDQASCRVRKLEVDGDNNSETVAALQTFLNTNWDQAGFQQEQLPVDGSWGPDTTRALQAFLNSNWDMANPDLTGYKFDTLRVDGVLGAGSVKALQMFLIKWDKVTRAASSVMSKPKDKGPAAAGKPSTIALHWGIQ